jgi:hypothetical protein
MRNTQHDDDPPDSKATGGDGGGGGGTTASADGSGSKDENAGSDGGSDAGGVRKVAKEAMSRIPGLKKELSHSNSITAAALPKLGIAVPQEKEDELAEVNEIRLCACSATNIIQSSAA